MANATINYSPAASGGGVSTASLPLVVTGADVAINAATTSTAGSLSAADKTKLDSMSSGGWFDTRALAMSALIPQITEFKILPLGIDLMGRGIALGNEGTLEGGGISNGAAGTVTALGFPITQNLKTNRWTMSFRAKLAVPDVTHTVSQVGWINQATTHGLFIGPNTGQDATHFVLRILGAGTTPVVLGVADANAHDWDVTFDLTTVTVYMDGVSAGSTAVLTNLMAEAAIPMISATVAHDVQIAKMLLGYVAA